MKYEDKTTQQDEKDRIIRIEMLAEGMGIDLDIPSYVECNIDLKKEELYE